MLLHSCSRVLSTGYVEQLWKHTVFTMLPKTGDKSLVQDRRSFRIAVGTPGPLNKPRLSPDHIRCLSGEGCADWEPRFHRRAEAGKAATREMSGSENRIGLKQ